MSSIRVAPPTVNLIPFVSICLAINVLLMISVRIRSVLNNRSANDNICRDHTAILKISRVVISPGSTVEALRAKMIRNIPYRATAAKFISAPILNNFAFFSSAAWRFSMVLYWS